MQINDFGQPSHVAALVHKIRSLTNQPWTLMEVCGGQTHAILRYGIDQLLPETIRIVHGPGCPVCVTPIEVIDRAIEIASLPEVIFCTFGDMLRVPGTDSNLMRAKSQGADIRIIQNPMEATKLAESEMGNPGIKKQVVLFAIGFETTAPATAMAIRTAKKRRLNAFSALVCHVLVPPALDAIFSDPDQSIDGLLAAGHVCTIAGYRAYESIANRFQVPIAITGFEPVDLLRGILNLIEQLQNSPPSYRVENVYEHIATLQGNRLAQASVDEVFQISDQLWRGIGKLPKSGLTLNDDYRDFDANLRFPHKHKTNSKPSICQAADVLRGKIRPIDCIAFGTSCTPSNPLGAPMVSSEGACAAYHLYQTLTSISKASPESHR